MAPLPTRSPHRRLYLLAGGAYFAGYAVWAFAMLAGTATRGLFNDLLFLPFYLACAWAGLRAATAPPEGTRWSRGWRLIGLAWLLSGAGSLLWMVHRFWPSDALDWLAWSAYNLYYPLAVLGLWRFFERPSDLAGRTRLGVEVLIAMVATAILAWYFVFRFDQATGGLVETFRNIGVLFLGELLIIGGASAVLNRPSPMREARSLVWLGLGSFSATIADFAYQQNRLIQSSWSGPTGDLLLALGATLVFTGAASRRMPDQVTAGAPSAVTVGLGLLPYVAVAVVAGLLVFDSVRANLGRGPIAGLIVGGAVLLLLVIVRLLLAQREVVRAAAARAAQDARFRSLVHRSSDAIVVTTTEGTIRWASPAFARMARVAESDVEQRSLFHFMPPDQADPAAAWLASPGERGLASWRIGREGSWREVEAIATDSTKGSAVGGIVINLRDVTERVRLEAELRQAQKMEVVGRLASSTAHDFNNLLTVVLGNLELARVGDPTVVDHSLGEAEAAARRGVTLTRQLLSLAKPTTPSPRPTLMAPLIRKLQGSLRTVLPSSIILRTETTDEPLLVTIDEVQLEQILLNLVLNARDAMPGGGTLDLGLARREAERGVAVAEISVADSGSGMTTDTLMRAFEPFFTTKPVGLGTGLGLATVRRLTTELGGSVAVESAVGRGTTVRLRFPLAKAEREAVREPRPAARASVGQGHVLLVDDDMAVRRVLGRQLRTAGFRVTDAPDGATALAALEEGGQSIDVVLTDLVMPGMRGEELARRVMAQFPAVKVLCMSGTPAEPAAGSEPWASGRLLVKPLEIDAVAARISAHSMT